MKRLFALTLAAGALAYVLSPLPGESKTPLGERIDKRRATVDRARVREGVLTDEIAGDRNRVSAVQAQLSGTRRRLGRAQTELDDGRRRLIALRDRGEVARDRLASVRERLKGSRKALSRRLVELYKADQPDLLTVVLSADGFEDLLERTEFMQLLAERDGRVLTRTRRLKAAAERQARRLARLERAAQLTAQGLLRRRDDIAAARDQLVTDATALRQAQSRRRQTLARVRNLRTRAQEDLVAMEAQQARIARRLRAASASPGVASQPVRRGSGRFVWPLRGTLTSPFGPRWGRLHAGLDISVPEGTPIRAADDGRVALAAPTGGYGNYTCVQHAGGISTCYAHQSRLGTSAGRAVRQGQVIGFSGNTGNSTGPHLHFETRSGGSPVNPFGFL